MIPKYVIVIIESKAIKILFITLWILSFLWTMDRSWVNDSWEVIGSEVIHKVNYFDFNRRPLFIALTVILCGYILHLFREKSQSYFGLVELLFGFLGAYLTLYNLPLNILETWLALAGALFLTISGLRNIKEGI